jgi:hypothetical protein
MQMSLRKKGRGYLKVNSPSVFLRLLMPVQFRDVERIA